VETTDSGLGTLDRQVFMAAGETPEPSGTRPDRYFEDISPDKLSTNAPADETNDDKNARCERNRKRNEHSRCLRETLPIQNLAETLDQVANWVHTTPEKCLMSITTIALLTVKSCIKVRLDLQADKSPIVVKGPFFPRVMNPRYRICRGPP
jgi:hypothetical protein